MSDTQKKKRNVYSFALKKTDSPIIKEFIENQTNFSETVRYLIYKYVSENDTNDISYKFNELLFSNAMSLKSNKNENINTNNTDITKNSNDTNYEDGKSTNDTNYEDTNLNNDTNYDTEISEDIPDCYK